MFRLFRFGFPSHKVQGWNARSVQHVADTERSVPRELTPPIDNAIVDGAAYISDSMVSAGVTPNMISVCGGIVAVMALVALWFNHLVLFVVLFALSYLADTVDGWVARTYNMKSKAGEWLDHGKDIVITVALVGIVLYKNVFDNMPVVVSLLILAFYSVSLIAEGCVQRSINNDDNMVGGLQNLCPSGVDGSVSRHVSTPTFLAVTGAVIIGLCVYRRGKRSGSVWS